MNILMMTNTYRPHVGGVASSVDAFADEYRARGHRVVVVAPEFPDTSEMEDDVVRVPAIENFNGTDFSVRLPIPGILSNAFHDFTPDIVHSHHPFLLGDTAQRVAARFDVPLIFTHHTMYERYTHYVPGDSPAMKRFVIDLATHYANLCDHVFAPSESVAAILRERGVQTPIEPLPTGVDVRRFASGDRHATRRRFNIPSSAFVVGHLGRLAPEKNLPFLAKAIAVFLRRNSDAHFLVVGTGPSEQEIRDLFRRHGVQDRVHVAGICQGQELVDAYHAMDVFAFASTSETQGMVLTEAMAAGVPVVAIDAPGAREVVVDQVNGRLLSSQDSSSFSEALAWIANFKEIDVLRVAAWETADNFAMSRCADRALQIYESLIDPDRVSDPDATLRHHDSWESTLRLIETEYQLWLNRAAAITTAIQGNYLTKMPIVRWVKHYLRRFRRAISRNEWAARLLKLPKSEGTAVEPGLILVQIDGLSRTQLERALEKRRLPFLRRLIDREGYQLHTMYSGLPSTTPAVQGELFYGVPGAVPAFSYRDGRTGKSVRMFDRGPAANVQRRLATAGPGLLEGGSAYANVYSGGADEAHFCAATFGWGDFWRAANPFALAAFCLFHIFSLIRILSLLAVESGLAVIDFFRGLITGRDLWKELKFIPTRVGICVLMREFNVIGASIDATRGLPVIHVNFLGYDEQAHRRGPTSAFAHWSLKGIDHAIRRISDAAHRSYRRDYLIWIYSDHGQEEVVPYPLLSGKSIHDTVAEVVKATLRDADEEAPQNTTTRRAAERRDHQPDHSVNSEGIEHQRSRWLGAGLHRLLSAGTTLFDSLVEGKTKQTLVTAMGPIAHVYLPEEAKASETLRESIARRLVREACVPVALYSCGEGIVGWTDSDRIVLPRDRLTLLGEAHPFRDAVAEDLVALCQHPDAGDVVLCGWRNGEKSVSFPMERGAHAGPGPEETRAFALLPMESSFRLESAYLRPYDLRQVALELLHLSTHFNKERRSEIHRRLERHPVVHVREDPKNECHSITLRVLTYNVHSCIGMDGRMSPKRIARLISRCRPDIVALQEVDVGRSQSDGLDQPHLIAHELEMDHYFHAAWQVEEEQYGNAVLSRFPMQLVDVARLPQSGGRMSEPRGVMRVELSVSGQLIRLVNTHLGLTSQERWLQVDALLGKEWLTEVIEDKPLILCGDFNMLPRSAAYRRIAGQLRDAQVAMHGHRPAATWSSAYPLGRVDHVFVSEHFNVVTVEIKRSQLARVASDHLPVMAELSLQTPDAAYRSNAATDPSMGNSSRSRE